MDNKTNKHEFACNAGKVTEYEVKEHIDMSIPGDSEPPFRRHSTAVPF